MLPLVLASKIVTLVADTLLEVEAEEPEMKETSAKRTRSINITNPIAKVSLSVSNSGLLSKSRNFLSRMGADIKIVEIEDEIRSNLRAKFEHLRRG